MMDKGDRPVVPIPMQPFQPPGFTSQSFSTSLGAMVYYTPTAAPWDDISSVPEQESPLLFLHSLGGGSSAYEWSKVYPAFATTYPIIAPDLIGWGFSAHPPHQYTAESYVDVLGEFLTQGLSQPAVVIATSLTAALMVRVAIAHPDRVRALFLVAPSGYGDFGTNYRQSLSAQLAGTPLVDRLLYQVGAANEWAIRNFMEQFLFAERSRITDEMVQAYLASAQQPNAEYAALASLKGDICFDLSFYIPQLRVPTFLLWGERSRLSSLDRGRRLAQLNTTAIRDFVAIPHAGVLPQLEWPTVVVGVFQSWLKRLQSDVET
jgi:pimeloyl-ACP methyl ester carboxylesterase